MIRIISWFRVLYLEGEGEGKMRARKIKMDTKAWEARLGEIQYGDTFSCYFKSGKKVEPAKLQYMLWTDYPWIVQRLMALRGWLVRPFGLVGKHKMDKSFVEEWVGNGEVRHFITDLGQVAEEVMVKADDKHLTFWFALTIIGAPGEEQEMQGSTLVRFNNRFGPVYFGLIAPFHRILVGWMLKRLIKKVI